jgi:hypothetical protein
MAQKVSQKGGMVQIAAFWVLLLLCLAPVEASFASDTNADSGGASQGRNLMIAGMVAERMFTDAAYDGMLNALSTQFIVAASASSPSIAKANAENSGKMFNAVSSVLARSMTKDAVKEAVALAISKHFSSSELKEILAFMSSPTGARYITLSSDQGFSAEVIQNINIPSSVSKDIANELHRLFPKQTFGDLNN